ncbi:MAG: ABC transporter substrate-binding protein [Desulfocucumaceae bacterium]
MKRFVKIMVLLTLAIALLAAAGCGGGNKDAGQAKEAKVLNIGFTGPLSGGAAFYGKDILTGLEMGVDQVNAAGGITVAGQKYTLKIASLDDRYLPNEAATNARRLVNESNASVIFCPHSGGIAAMQEFNQTENFLIAAYSSEPKLYARGNKLTLLLPPPYNSYIEPFIKKIMAEHGKKVALIQGNAAYGKDWGTQFAPAWEKAGGTITINSPFDYNKETDFAPYVSKALATKPDVLFVGGASQPTAMVIKQARDQGFKGGLIVLDQAKFEDMADIIGMPALEGAIGIYPYYLNPRPDKAARDKFVNDYKAKYGKRPTYEHVWHYETALALAKAFEKAGTVKDSAKIFEAMRQVLPLDKSIAPIGIEGVSTKGGYTNLGMAAYVKNGQYGDPIDIPRTE